MDFSKLTDGGFYYTSRLMSRKYADGDATLFTTKSLTLQNFTQRLALSLATSFEHICSHIRGILQRYIELSTTVKGDIYICPPVEMNLSPESRPRC